MSCAFGLILEPSIWTSSEDVRYWVQFTTFRFGYVAHWFHLMGDARELPGAPASQLWIGLELGRASQATIYLGEPVHWEASISFRRWDGFEPKATQWAVTPDRSAFFVESDSTAQFPGSEHERRTGGPGTPAGNPASLTLTPTEEKP